MYVSSMYVCENYQMHCSQIESLCFSIKKDTPSQTWLFTTQSAYADDHVNFQNMYETGSCQSVIQCLTFSEPCIVIRIREKDQQNACFS
jgi:hypothetical protein